MRFAAGDETMPIKPITEERKQMKVADYLTELKARFGEEPKNWKVVCPNCNTVQSVQDFYDAGIKEASDYFGYSCIGRFTKDKGCDWTLGGLFQIHNLELIDEEGKPHPRFEIAEMQAANSN